MASAILTVAQLKAELRKRNALTTGRKATLIERLESYDRNANFSRGDVVLPEPILFPSWPDSGFQQLQLDHQRSLPNLNRSIINGYFQYRLATDKQASCDMKALEKGELLLESKNIDACSVNVTFKDVFVTGIVRAAMKKRLSYNYKLRIQSQTGEILNTHCECPAGKGPHGTCKHVASVLLMLSHFIKTNEILVTKTCTENQQTFHKPRSLHRGSPVKAQYLQTGKKTMSMDDPRPAKYRNLSGYQDHVRNAVINFCSNTSKDITMRFLYPKANLEAAVMDHDYLDIPFTEHWVDRSIKVTEAQAVKVEMDTKGQTQSKLWFEERQNRVTASRFGDVCKMTDRRNKEKLCNSLLTTQHLNTNATMHGRTYEHTAIEQFEIESGLIVQPSGFFISVEHPFLGATPDGIIDINNIVEIKCPYSGRFEKILPGPNFRFLHMDNGQMLLKTSSNYYFQVQGQLFISKRQYCYFVVFTFEDFFVQKIKFNEDFFQHSILPKLSLFWFKYMRPYISKNM